MRIELSPSGTIPDEVNKKNDLKNAAKMFDIILIDIALRMKPKKLMFSLTFVNCYSICMVDYLFVISNSYAALLSYTALGADHPALSHAIFNIFSHENEAYDENMNMNMNSRCGNDIRFVKDIAKVASTVRLVYVLITSVIKCETEHWIKRPWIHHPCNAVEYVMLLCSCSTIKVIALLSFIWLELLWQSRDQIEIEKVENESKLHRCYGNDILG
ncbi:hypothetical protein T09_9044 [Trichinella sp. T9]|nr:hypothetical protein T09_9044 [Trichinella sp. T9]